MNTTNNSSRPVFTRVGGALLAPRPNIGWEAGGVFAPAVLKTPSGYVMYYRAFGADKISRLGVATSRDGLAWSAESEPLLSPADDQEKWGMEDPRAVRIGGLTAIAYTAASGYQAEDGWHWTTRVRLATSRNGRSFVRHDLKMPEINDKDATLFPRKINGRYWMLHRYMPDVWVSNSSDLLVWHDHRRIMEPVPGGWQCSRIGAGAAPIETELGWLVFYHGVSRDMTYSMSAVILDIDDPGTVRFRLPYPLIVPVEPYELKGYVPNVVFGTSVTDEGDRLRMYYGAADFVVAAAEIDKAALITALAAYPAESARPRALPAATKPPKVPSLPENPWGMLTA